MSELGFTEVEIEHMLANLDVFSPEETVIEESTTDATERAHNAMSGYLAGDDEGAIAEVKGALECRDARGPRYTP